MKFARLTAYSLFACAAFAQSTQPQDRRVRQARQGVDHAARVHEPAGGPSAQSAPACRPRRTSSAITSALPRSSPTSPISASTTARWRPPPSASNSSPPAPPTKAASASSPSIADEETIRNLDTYKGLPRPARRSARTQRRRGQTHHRPGQADLHVHRRPAQRRDRTAGDADGTGLPPRRRGVAALRLHPQERHRDARQRRRTRRPRPLRRLVLPLHAQPGNRAGPRCPARPTGASTSSTTTIATSITRRSPCATG